MVSLCAPTTPPTQAVVTDSVEASFDKLIREFDKGKVACMKGNSINLVMFETDLREAVIRGFCLEKDADYILNGLTNGFDLEHDAALMPEGANFYPNYSTAYDNAQKVTDALLDRVARGKTIKLGPWSEGDDFPTDIGCNVPQGAVPKKMEPEKMRPYSDHTKTLFNKATDQSSLRHSLDTYNEIAQALLPGYYMRVEDVDGAYPTLPLHPSKWKYMYVYWYDVHRPLEEQTSPNTLYVHVFGDFGTSTMPGIWDRFFRCVKAMAQCRGILTLPMPHYVDDNSIIGPDKGEVDRVAEQLGDYLEQLGVPFKRLKSREAALVQLVLGFWWDSVNRTRALEPTKYKVYLDHLRSALGSQNLTLKEMQILSGRMQRAGLTMPPGALVYLTGILRMMRGLKMPWHRRRISAEVRSDLRMLIAALETNGGRGYFAYDAFARAPAVFTDAAKERAHTGGGFFSESGAYDYWQYGSAMSRHPIDYLEGDAFRRAAYALGHTWKHCIVPVHIDNTAFCYSLRKGRSKADRLNEILRELFLISVKYECLFEPHWISTHDNVGADALSRGDLPRFAQWVREHYGGGLRLSRVSEYGALGGARDSTRKSLEALKPQYDFNSLE